MLIGYMEPLGGSMVMLVKVQFVRILKLGT